MKSQTDHSKEIEELKKRIEELERRPIYFPVYPVAPLPEPSFPSQPWNPYPGPGTPWFPQPTFPPYTITCSVRSGA